MLLAMSMTSTKINLSDILSYVIMSYLRKYPLTFFCVIAIWVLCLMKTPSTKLDEIENIDKLYHVMMYLGACSILWWEYLRRHHKIVWHKIWLFAILFPIAMGGMIELVQAYFTVYRSGNWGDFFANVVGVMLAVVGGRWGLPQIIHRFFRK